MHTPKEHHAPETKKPTRRELLKQLAGTVATGVLFEAIGVTEAFKDKETEKSEKKETDPTNNPITEITDNIKKNIPSELKESLSEEELSKVTTLIETELNKELTKLEAENPNLNKLEKTQKLINYLGTGLFFKGIGNLLTGKHIDQTLYIALIALSIVKYQVSDAEGKHHLVDETLANAKAAAIISGTVIFAEGLNANIEKAFEELIKNRPLKDSDKVALTCMLASVVSPLATTVSSAGLMKNLSNELAGENTDAMAAFISHISNLSGFTLFGDPPFIAVVQKYGFEEAIKWQLSMFPLAAYSLVSSVFKINYFKAKERKEANPMKTAIKESKDGLIKNIGFLSLFVGNSITNAAKYFTGASLKYPQSEKGVQGAIHESLEKTIKAAFTQLPFAQIIEDPHHESHEGRTETPQEKRNYTALTIAGIKDSESKDKEIPEETWQKLAIALESNSITEAEQIMQEAGINFDLNILKTFKDLADDGEVNNSSETPESIQQKLNPLRVFDRITDIERLKAALGHNLADIVNVFPFQAGCVPFLAPVFQEALTLLDGLDESTRETVIFFLLMAFSSIADNYVACLLGLGIMPDKPQIPLIASILGGQLSSIGNMANVAQFSLDKYPLGQSYTKFLKHADTIAVGLAWAKLMGWAGEKGWFLPPLPKEFSNQGH